MGARLIRLRYPGNCATCGTQLAVGTKARWDSEARTTTCVSCHEREPEEASEVDVAETRPLDVGEAGASARREYERRHARREQRIDERWGKLAGVVKFLVDDPQSTRAWAKGSVGEQRLAERLRRDIGDRTVLLNDRRVPGTKGNIDHLAVASSGVWVIDAKNHRGTVEHRDVGGWFKTDHRLYVGGRDKTKLARSLGWQVAAVQGAVAEAQIPISAALCFIEAEWKMLAKPFQLEGVWVTWAKKLEDMIAAPGPLGQEDVLRVAERLAAGLPSAV